MKYNSLITLTICTLLTSCLGCQGANETTSSTAASREGQQSGEQATDQDGGTAADHAAASRNSGKPSFMEEMQTEALKGLMPRKFASIAAIVRDRADQ